MDTIGIEGMLERAIGWLEKHPSGWEFDYGPTQLIPTYNVALAVICCHQLGLERFSDQYEDRIRAAVEALLASRCDDGGWASRGWDRNIDNWPISESTGEVGATSLAVRALVETGSAACNGAIARATEWLVGQQGFEGYWSDRFMDNSSDIPKTCDAVQALASGMRAGISDEQITSALDKALSWLEGQERAIFVEGRIGGWGWDVIPREINSTEFQEGILAEIQNGEDSAIMRRIYRENSERCVYHLREKMSEVEREVAVKVLLHSGCGSNFTSTCLTLETLVETSKSHLPLLSSSVKWLVGNQHQSGRTDVGMWGRNTARITRSLLKFCRRLQQETLKP